MGLFDNMTSIVNKGAAAASRTSRSAKLRLEQGELLKQRKELAAQLGASLYESLKDSPEYREGRESLFDGIAGIDERRAQIEDEIARIEAEAQSAAVATRFYSCPQCGARVAESDAFCTGCGLSGTEVKAAYARDDSATSAAATPSGLAPSSLAPSGLTCAACGAPMEEDDLFCMTCGAKREPADAPADAPAASEPGQLAAESAGADAQPPAPLP